MLASHVLWEEVGAIMLQRPTQGLDGIPSRSWFLDAIGQIWQPLLLGRLSRCSAMIEAVSDNRQRAPGSRKETEPLDSRHLSRVVGCR